MIYMSYYVATQNYLACNDLIFHASIETRSDSKNKQPTNLPIQRISSIFCGEKKNEGEGKKNQIMPFNTSEIGKIVQSKESASVGNHYAVCMNFAGKYPIASLICRYCNLFEKKNIWCRKKKLFKFWEATEKRREANILVLLFNQQSFTRFTLSSNP